MEPWLNGFCSAWQLLLWTLDTDEYKALSAKDAFRHVVQRRQTCSPKGSVWSDSDPGLGLYIFYMIVVCASLITANKCIYALHNY